MRVTRDLIAEILFTLLGVIVTGYFIASQPLAPPANSSGIEASSCGQFAATYEHNESDPDHVHDFNAYGLNEQLPHAHVTSDYRIWLAGNLSGLVTRDTLERYRAVTPSVVAGLLYTLYRVCRVNYEKPFVTVVDMVINGQPGLRSTDTYIEGSDGE
jgi:hypothetical protein